MAFDRHDEAQYLANFQSIVSASYSELQNANAPSGLLSSCVNQGKLNSPLVDVTVSTDGAGVTEVSSIQVQSDCGYDSHCIIPPNAKLIMESDLNVGALTLDGGQLEWTDNTFGSNHFLCAGYIIADGSSSLFNVGLQQSDSRGWIYLKNNGAVPNEIDKMGMRVLGTSNGGNMIVKGRAMKRTWTLLKRGFSLGESQIELLHDVAEMGWEVGDRIGVAPTQHASYGTGQTFTISSMHNYTVQLSHANTEEPYEATFINGQSSSPPVLKASEVVNLSRNIIITGDDFEHINCDPSIRTPEPHDETSAKGCKCSTRTKCTVGLHHASWRSGRDDANHTYKSREVWPTWYRR